MIQGNAQQLRRSKSGATWNIEYGHVIPRQTAVNHRSRTITCPYALNTSTSMPTRRATLPISNRLITAMHFDR
jgi:hypothetical protein